MSAKSPYKNLTRSKSNRSWLGVCGGLGEYLNLDPVVIRLLFVFGTVFSGFIPGLVVYFVAALIIPEKAEISKK